MTSYKVYKITNRLNGKIYIGQTKQSLEKRFMQHLHTNSPLGQAMRQCGTDNFTIEVIEECENQEQLNEREKFWIKVLNCKVPNGYNLADGGYGYVRKAAVAMLTVAESFKRFRQKFKLSQKDVAEKIGMKQQLYSSYESPKNPVTPSVNLIIKLSGAYNVSADYLLGLTDNPAPNIAPPAESVGAMSTAKATGDTAPIAEERINQLEERLDRYDSWFKRKGIDI